MPPKAIVGIRVQEARLVAMPACFADMPCTISRDGVKLTTMM
jgi:hypothetical protein